MLNGIERQEEQLFIEKSQQLSEELRSEVMTIAQQIERRGLQKGIQQGMQQGSMAILLKLLQLRFQEIPIKYVQSIQQADSETLIKLAERVIHANTIDEVFNYNQ